MNDIDILKYELKLWKNRFNNQVRHNIKLQ